MRNKTVLISRPQFFIILLISSFMLSFAHASPVVKGPEAEIDAVEAVLEDYIQGTANGDSERLEKAFHPDFSLYWPA